VLNNTSEQVNVRRTCKCTPTYKKLNTTTNYRLNNKTSFISFKIVLRDPDMHATPATLP